MPAVAPDLWLPLAAVTPLVGADWRNDGRAHWEVLARLAPAASLPAAAAELSSLSRSIPDSVGKPIPIAVRAATFFQADAGEFAVLQQASVAFMVALALMLCIAAVNLVNLFAARNAARASEVTVRLALGANRGRIARQLVSESVLLSLAGGALGLLGSRVLTDWIERWIVSTMAAISGGFTAVTLDLSIDWRIALYTAALTLVIGVVVGVWPAQIAARGDMNALLRRGGTSTADAGTWTKRNTLLAVQIASCIILLTAAGMLLGGVRRSHTIDPHFDTAHLLVVTVHDDAPFPQRAERRAEIQRRLAALPGVRAVSWTLRAPFNGTHLRRVGTARGSVTISLDNVDESYFDAIGLPLLRGRAFTRREIEDSAGVMIISESMARFRWPGADAVGRSLRPGDPFGGPDTTKAYTVIGVVPDIRSQFLSRANGPSAYFPYDMNKPLGSFLVRTRGEPELLENEVRTAIGLVSPILVARTFVVTMQAGPMALQRLMAEAPATVALLIAVLGLGLASVGVFGVISQIVVRRTREIGIHVALGARGRDVVWMVALKTLRPVMWGTAFGAVAALGLSLFLRSLIAMPDVPDLTLGAGAFNPAVFVGVAGVLALVVVAALGVPAWRAVRIDPVRALASD
jgi:predicted permease